MTRNILASRPYYSSFVNACFEINMCILDSCVLKTYIQLWILRTEFQGILPD